MEKKIGTKNITTFDENNTKNIEKENFDIKKIFNTLVRRKKIFFALQFTDEFFSRICIKPLWNLTCKKG